LREKGLAPYAEHWLKQLIFAPLEMDQQVCSSSCFNQLMIFELDHSSLQLTADVQIKGFAQL